jgi:hypothetical protein
MTFGLALAPEAQATTAREWSLKDLVGASDRCVVGEAVAKRSEWVYLGGSKRIVTFTRFVQERDLLADNAEEDELELLTLGGRVGSLLQKVPGAPAVKQGERGLLFVAKEQDGSRHIVGMAQGHFPIMTGEHGEFLQRSPELPHLLSGPRNRDGGRSDSAVVTLHGCALTEAISLIRAARR